MPDDLYSAVLLLSFAVDGFSGLFQASGGCLAANAAGSVLVGHFTYPAYARALKDAEACNFADSERSWLLSRLSRPSVVTGGGAGDGNAEEGAAAGSSSGGVLSGGSGSSGSSSSTGATTTGGAGKGDASPFGGEQQDSLQWERGVATVAQDFYTIDQAIQARYYSSEGLTWGLAAGRERWWSRR